MFIFGLVFFVFLKFPYCDFLRIIVVGDKLAARRSSRNTDNTLGWIALGLLCFIAWLIYKLVLEIIIFVTTYWIGILIFISVLGLIWLGVGYRQQKEAAERLACEKIAEEQKQILDEMDRKAKLALDKIKQQHTEVQAEKYIEIATQQHIPSQQGQAKEEQCIQFEKEATLCLAETDAELTIGKKRKTPEEVKERRRLLRLEKRIKAEKIAEAARWLQEYNNHVRLDTEETKQVVIKSNKQSCSGCGKLYDCSESFVNFADGCNGFYPAKRSW